jgi:hypothetical protein
VKKHDNTRPIAQYRRRYGYDAKAKQKCKCIWRWVGYAHFLLDVIRRIETDDRRRERPDRERSRLQSGDCIMHMSTANTRERKREVRNRSE